MKKTVYLVGGTDTAYRPGLWASYFMERGRQYDLISDSCSWHATRFRALNVILRQVHLIYVYFISDTIVIQPMNHVGPYSRTLCFLNRFLRKRIVMDIYLSSYETKVIDRCKLDPDNPAAKHLWKKERHAFQSASLLLFLTRAEREYYTSILKLDAKSLNTSIVPLVTPERPKAKRPYLEGRASVPTFAWWGREGNPLHGFENIAKACEILLEKGVAVKFAFFASGGKNWESFKREWEHLAAHPNVLFTCDYTFGNGRLQAFLENETDFALGTFGETKKAQTVLVNKILDAAAFGIPCITQTSQGCQEFFQDGEHIIFANCGPNDIADKLESSLKNKSLAVEIGDRSRALVSSKFSTTSFQQNVTKALTK